MPVETSKIGDPVLGEGLALSSCGMSHTMPNPGRDYSAPIFVKISAEDRLYCKVGYSASQTNFNHQCKTDFPITCNL